MHKLASIGAIVPIACGEDFIFNGNKGVYIFDISLGTDTGIVYFNYEAYDIPDRFILEYDSVEVADSLYVGDSLTGNPPDYAGMVGTTFSNVPEFNWDGNLFFDNGDEQEITVQQADVAAFGETAGAGFLKFVKGSASPSIMNVTIPAVLSGTAWVVKAFCPVEGIAASITEDDVQEEGDTLCTSCATITVELNNNTAVNIANAGTDINLALNRITVTAHDLGGVSDVILAVYSTSGTPMTYLDANLVTRPLEVGHIFEFEVIDANTLEFTTVDIDGLGTNTHTFTPVVQNKRVEFTLTGDVGGSYSDVLTLCSGGGTDISTDTTDNITATKTYRFGIDGVKEAGMDNFSNTITVNVYDDDTNVLDDTYVLTRTHNNTSC